MTKYFIHDGNKELGPFTLIELTSQNINAQTPVWHKGLSGWTKASDLDELQPLLASKDSPPIFKKQESGFPPFTRAWGKGSKGIPVGYIISGLILISGILFWYILTRDNGLSIQSDKDNETRIDSSKLKTEQADQQRIIAEVAAKNANYRNNWNRYIWVKNDDYKHGLLGGIYGLEVIIVNETEYKLDEIVVLVQYIKENGRIHKTEPVTIYNVPARGEASVPAPDSNRGTSIKMAINAISSRKMNFCYSSDIDVRSSDDPYRCIIN
ncbi:MAG TPA: DUF4339 domain-containing protein [Sphingobacteriaceae bacterium]